MSKLSSSPLFVDATAHKEETPKYVITIVIQCSSALRRSAVINSFPVVTESNYEISLTANKQSERQINNSIHMYVHTKIEVNKKEMPTPRKILVEEKEERRKK